MKRLFVRPEWRTQSLGRRLAEAALGRAKAVGYSWMKLDTLSTMTAANRLYESLGFVDCPPYTHNPLPEVRFMHSQL